MSPQHCRNRWIVANGGILCALVVALLWHCRAIGSLIPKCNVMNPLRPFVPCESVCNDYTTACGRPRELLCSVFGDPDDPDPQATGKEPFPMCKGTSSFPRFMHREWLALMPGIDPADKELALAELRFEMERDPAAYAADAEESYAAKLDEEGAAAKPQRTKLRKEDL